MRPARAVSRRPLRRRLARAVAILALLVPLAGAASAHADETLAYRWSLRGLGRVAGLVMPSQGRGELRSKQANGGHITELEITSPAADKSEFFLYGGETRADGTTSRAWSSYKWRGRSNSERNPVEQDGVVDVASGIHLIRQRHPDKPMSLRIWSDGKVYPVVVTRVGSEPVNVPAGSFVADHYRIRGVRRADGRSWKGGLDIWLAKDEVATPVRIQVERGFANVRLELLSGG